MTAEQAPPRRTGPFALAGLLWCGGCDYPLAPSQAGGRLSYACSGPDRRHVDATAVERVVHTVAERHAAALVTGVPAECRAGVYRQLFARVVVGATPDDVTVTWRA